MRRSGLDDERAFLLASLEDLERERAAGDLSEHDYETLRDRYTSRAAEVLRALRSDGASSGASPDVSPGAERSEGVVSGPVSAAAGEVASAPSAPGAGRGRRRRRGLAVGGVLVITAGVALLLLTTSTTVRLPGQTISGSVTLSRAQTVSQTLAQAETLEAEGEDAEAFQVYQRVLALDPSQPEAMAEAPWLEFQAGVQAKDPSVLGQAQQLEEKAAQADPSADAPHLYLGSMLLVEGDAAGAVTQFRLFLGDDPPVEVVQSAETVLKRAFTDAGDPVPALPPPAG